MSQGTEKKLRNHFAQTYVKHTMLVKHIKKKHNVPHRHLSIKKQHVMKNKLQQLLQKHAQNTL